MLTINKRDVREFVRHVRGLGKRFEAAQVQFMLAEVVHMHHDIMAGAPDIDGYAKSLMVATVKGKVGQWPLVIGIFGQRRRVRLSDDAKGQERLVLYVQPTEAGTRMPWINLLASVIWTADTLPAEPPKRLAKIVARRVSQREFDWASAESAAKRPDIAKSLAGMKIPLLTSKAEIQGKVEMDLAFEVLRAEFGLGGVKGQAHWRPAIQRTEKRFKNQAFQQLVRWLAYSDAVRYTPQGSVVRRRVSPKLAASVSGFQQRIRP